MAETKAPYRQHGAPAEASKAEIYAKEGEGRSKMSKAELARAVGGWS